MTTKFVVTLEVQGRRDFAKLGTISSDAPLAECLAAMLVEPAAKELLAKHPDQSFKIRVQVRR